MVAWVDLELILLIQPLKYVRLQACDSSLDYSWLVFHIKTKWYFPEHKLLMKISDFIVTWIMTVSFTTQSNRNRKCKDCFNKSSFRFQCFEFLFVVLNRVSCIRGWPQVCYVVETSLELLILLSSVLGLQAYTVTISFLQSWGIKPIASCMLESILSNHLNAQPS